MLTLRQSNRISPEPQAGPGFEMPWIIGFKKACEHATVISRPVVAADRACRR
jgi:hypothetical protein